MIPMSCYKLISSIYIHIMVVQVNAIVAILVIVFYVVDTSDRSTSEHRDSETEQLEDQEQAAKVTATTEDPSIETDKTDSKSTHDPNKSSPISQEFTIQDDLFIHGAAAPEYIDEDQIVFSLDQDRSYIISIDKRTETWEILYETSNQEIINSLVGYEKQLFWVEYPRQMDVDTPWVMKTMDLNNKEIRRFQNGVAKDYTLPPVLRVFENQLTWIDKIMKGDIMIITALVYDIETGLIEEVASEALDERDKEYRDGVFFILQRPVVDGMLIHQTVFTPDKTSDERTFELVHYPYDPEAKPQKIADNAEQIIDFTSDYDWIVRDNQKERRAFQKGLRLSVHCNPENERIPKHDKRCDNDRSDETSFRAQHSVHSVSCPPAVCAVIEREDRKNSHQKNNISQKTDISLCLRQPSSLRPYIFVT